VDLAALRLSVILSALNTLALLAIGLPIALLVAFRLRGRRPDLAPPPRRVVLELIGTVRVRATTEEGSLVRVTLDCGFRLVALVTRASATRLALAPGSRVAALVKAPSIRIVARPS
jgi:molybdopterin-binding protein